MKRVEVHEYQTPTRDNPDCAWSLGIMNLTKREAEIIAKFAYEVRVTASERSATGQPREFTTDDMREIIKRRNFTREEVLLFAEAERKRNSTMARLTTVTDTIDEITKNLLTEPTEPVRSAEDNRFSGLDL
jgi:hypothetical protein